MARSCNWSHYLGCDANDRSADASHVCAECNDELLCDLCVGTHRMHTGSQMRSTKMHPAPQEIRRDQNPKRVRAPTFKAAEALEGSQSMSAKPKRNPPSATRQLCTWQYSICQKAAPATHLCAECIETPGSGYLCEKRLNLHKEMDRTRHHTTLIRRCWSPA